METYNPKKHLIEGLVICGLGKDDVIVTMGVLENPQHEEQMIDWLEDWADTQDELPTANQILVAAVKIAGLME